VPHAAPESRSEFTWATSRAAGTLPAGELPRVAIRPALRSIALRSLGTLTWCGALGALAWLARGWISPWHTWVLWACAGVFGARISWEVLVRQSRLFACSDQRAIARFGVLSRNAIDLPWDRVQQVIVRRTLLERLFGLGTIGFATASGGVDLAWVAVARPWALHARVRGLVPAADLRSAPGVSVRAPSGPGAATEALPARPFVLGLAGGIGAGKSAAASVLRAMGWLVSDSDAGAREELRAPDVRDTLRAWWGEDILDASGAVDRAKVARIVFADSVQRTRLEGLIHPRLRAARERLKAEARERGAPGVVIDAPLLFEAGLDAECDAVLFIDAARALRLERVARTRAWSEEELSRREAAQMPAEEKKRRAHVVILNDGDEASLRARVEQAARDVLARGLRRVDATA
jgi:dephospho-CoA kinase